MSAKLKVGDQVVIRGEVKKIDKDGGIHVKLMDHTLHPGASYAGDACFMWPGAVFRISRDLLAALRKSLANAK